MPQANIFDKSTDILKARIDRAKGIVTQRFKNTKPYRKEPVSVEEQLYEYNTRGFEIFQQIADSQGAEAALLWQNKMEQEKARRQK